MDNAGLRGVGNPSPPNPYTWMAEAFWRVLDFICVGKQDDSTYVEDDSLAGRYG